jgi:hypothetical protein
MSEQSAIHVGADRARTGQQTGSGRRVKPDASRRRRRSLTGAGLTRLAGLHWPGRDQPRLQETPMSHIDAPPTARQLGYLRALANATATTFTYPATRAQASREIDRLRRIDTAPPAREEQQADAQAISYASAVAPEELEGYGSSATWRLTVAPAARRSPGTLELARYTVAGQARVLCAERSRSSARITDRPRSGAGRSYVVESDLRQDDAEHALGALVADYLAQARELGEVPMASAAVRQMLGTAGADA